MWLSLVTTLGPSWRTKIVARFEVFTEMKIQVVVFWAVKPCNDVVGYQTSTSP